jgi:predicted transcriptional regulator
MQHETIPDPGRELPETETALLCALLASGGGLRSLSELALEVGRDTEQTELALASLHSTGLVHRCQEFTFPTRAVLRLRELDL